MVQLNAMHASLPVFHVLKQQHRAHSVSLATISTTVHASQIAHRWSHLTDIMNNQ